MLRLGGTARKLCNQLDPSIIRDGMVADLGDGNGAILQSPIAIIMRGLARKFAPLDNETNISAIAALMRYSVIPGKGIDEALARFDSVLHSATEQGMAMGSPGTAWLLLTGLGLPAASWAEVLQPLGGMLPASDTETLQMITRIRNTYHLYQSDGVADIGRHGGSGGGNYFTGDGEYFPTFAGSDGYDGGQQEDASWGAF